MRKYQPIWEAVRNNSTASLSAEPIMHRRIIQAVRKEKTKDLGWKMMCLEAGKKYELLDTTDGHLLTFTLADISPVNIASL